MKDKKGFTLIELLAVIVILAIIALIAVPIVLNMIESARKSSAESSTYEFIEAIEYNNAFAESKQAGYTEIIGTKTVSEIDVKMKGRKPTNGYVVIDTNRKVTSATLCVEGYNVIYNGKKAVVGSKGCNKISLSEPELVEYKCKKATTLNDDTTGITSNTKFGTNTGNTLVPGMALDCKVTKTGDYDHRFYYVTDLESNSDYAVLIYNNNTKVVDNTLSNDNTVGFAYDSAKENWHGPQSTIMDNLPAITDWDNISLSNTTRTIKSAYHDSINGHVYADATDDGNQTLPTTFSYSTKAARLLTYKEAVTACDPNNSVSAPDTSVYLNNCTYLMENTTYSNSSNKRYWLETPHTRDDTIVWYVDGSPYFLHLYYSMASDYSTCGVRPAIEVLKSEIDLS